MHLVTTETIVQTYVKLENRPGTLEKVARALGERRINIDAITLETVGSTGFARLHTARPKDTIAALRAGGIESYESEAVVASLPDRPGELARATAELAAAGLNIEAVSTTPDRRLVIRTSDNERAEQILRKL